MCKKKTLFFVLFCLSWALYSQESPDTSVTPILENLNQLEALLNNIEARSSLQENELERLNQIITDSRNISMTQGEYLNDLQNQLAQMSAIAERQSSLLKKSLLKSKILTVSLIVAVPAVIAGTAWLTGRVCK
jgi:uncharacterized coiled-coil protein SlyX